MEGAEQVIVLAHLSDTHIDGGTRNADRTARVMAYLDELPQPVDAVLVTGDIVDNGLAAEYERAQELLGSRHPVFTCPGNHDARAPYREVLLGEPSGDEPDAPINQAYSAGDAVIALCDSTIPGQPDGVLVDETIAWLGAVLDDTPDDVPVFVCFHHPPAMLYAPIIDDIRQHGEKRLADLVADHPQVVAFLCGHAHTPAATTFADRPLLVAPGIASTVKLPWEPGDVFDDRLPPAIAFHILDDDRRLTTHYRVIA